MVKEKRSGVWERRRREWEGMGREKAVRGGDGKTI